MSFKNISDKTIILNYETSDNYEGNFIQMNKISIDVGAGIAVKDSCFFNEHDRKMNKKFVILYLVDPAADTTYTTFYVRTLSFINFYRRIQKLRDEGKLIKN